VLDLNTIKNGNKISNPFGCSPFVTKMVRGTFFFKMNKKQMFKILECFKKHVGLSGYKILISKDYHKLDSLATVEPDIYEKTITITLSKEFKKKDDKAQRNILIHELVHARVEIFNMKVELLRNEEEEYLVNDITRGLEKLK
jgi:hypothetical protein